jgi:hypothetical protein
MFSTAMLNYIGDAILKTTPIPWSNVYLSLHTDDPGTTGANEVIVAGYVRQISTGLWAAGAGGVFVNNAIIGQFDGQGGGATALVKYAGLWSAATGGVFVMGGLLTDFKSIGPSDSINFEAGNVTLTLTSAT